MIHAHGAMLARFEACLAAENILKSANKMMYMAKKQERAVISCIFAMTARFYSTSKLLQRFNRKES